MQEPQLPHGLLDARLGFFVGAVRRRAKQVIWGWLEPYKLTPQQFWILQVLRETGPLSLHELAKRIWADDPTASRVVRTLSERGLLKSESDPHHGRRRLISLHEEGARIAPELAALGQRFHDGLEAGLDPAELDALRASLGRVLHNLDVLEAKGRTPKPFPAEPT
ncbi:MAG: MarR family transcriptional regulator [Holophagaceae bacterium]|nr:MarR family transcriptional regulator [Holophagaceae bacterium]